MNDVIHSTLIDSKIKVKKQRNRETIERWQKSKEDMKHAKAKAKLSEEESLRVGYKHGTPLEGGKIADSSPADIFSSAHNISSRQASQSHPSLSSAQHSQSSSNSGKTPPTNADSVSNNNNNNNNTTFASIEQQSCDPFDDNLLTS
ncbi:probable serine/threonine-protein kinase DDB_G0291918 [Durio zibethinus]|uniref:Probable serine/threonine-protein kinase DDB_G0291918 n=1 Tax=Durio zibethinus TaxID=66656 RepID=A0A6P5YB34_DURZI|nr:probable serine/threonine-protein kinase DDB_G0291918 [Durio zibethinus]